MIPANAQVKAVHGHAEVAYLRERPGNYRDQAFPAELQPAPPSQPSMIPPDQINGLHHTDRTLSATVHAIFKLLSFMERARGRNDREHVRTIANAPERRTRAYWIMSGIAIP